MVEWRVALTVVKKVVMKVVTTVAWKVVMLVE